MSSTYPELLVAPMPAELTRLGVEELRTAEAVDAAVKSTDSTLMMVVNLVCGCAAGKARPGITMALQHAVKPARVATVFAGVDVEATERARSYSPATPLRRRALVSCGTGRFSSSSSDGTSRIRPPNRSPRRSFGRSTPTAAPTPKRTLGLPSTSHA